MLRPCLRNWWIGKPPETAWRAPPRGRRRLGRCPPAIKPPRGAWLWIRGRRRHPRPAAWPPPRPHLGRSRSRVLESDPPPPLVLPLPVAPCAAVGCPAACPGWIPTPPPTAVSCPPFSATHDGERSRGGFSRLAGKGTRQGQGGGGRKKISVGRAHWGGAAGARPAAACQSYSLIVNFLASTTQAPRLLTQLPTTASPVSPAHSPHGAPPPPQPIQAAAPGCPQRSRCSCASSSSNPAAVSGAGSTLPPKTAAAATATSTSSSSSG